MLNSGNSSAKYLENPINLLEHFDVFPINLLEHLELFRLDICEHSKSSTPHISQLFTPPPGDDSTAQGSFAENNAASCDDKFIPFPQ
jgi:hypothetical protein